MVQPFPPAVAAARRDHDEGAAALGESARRARVLGRGGSAIAEVDRGVDIDEAVPEWDVGVRRDSRQDGRISRPPDVRVALNSSELADVLADRVEGKVRRAKRTRGLREVVFPFAAAKIRPRLES